MFQGSFGDLCDQLWRDWLHEELSDSEFGGLSFDKDSAPEPWLELRSGTNPLFVVTTNPGGSMDIQKHSVVKQGDSPIILPKQTYASSTVGLGQYYEANLPKGFAAERRIKSMVQLATLAGYDGLYQVEACPFHSTSFPDKKKFVSLLEKDTENIMSRYATHLRQFLSSQDLLGLSAVSSQHSLDRDRLERMLSKPGWLSWFSALIGVELSQSTLIPLTTKTKESVSEEKITSTAIIQRAGGRTKILLLMMGSNNPPGTRGIARLAQAMSGK